MSYGHLLSSSHGHNMLTQILIFFTYSFLADSVIGQRLTYHSPVVHHGSARSFQSFTYFGKNPQSPPVSTAPVQAPAPAPSPFRAPAPAPTNSFIVRAPAPAPFVARAPAPSPFVARAPAPAPATTLFRTAAPAVAPVTPSALSPINNYVKTRKIYKKPVVSRFRPLQPTASPSFRQEFTTTQFTTTTFKPSVLRVDVPAATIVDDALDQVKAQGPKLVRIVKRLQENKLLSRFLSSDPSDACTLIPDNIASTVEDLNAAVISSRSDLITIVSAAQEMKRNENNTEIVLLEASKALQAVGPLVPIFGNIFPRNSDCDSSITATIEGFDTVGNLLGVLGTTNLVTSDADTQANIVRGGEATKILGNVARKLEADGFTRLCEDSPTFSSDVFMGVSELLDGFKNIAAAFDATSELSQLDRTVAVVRDGAVSFHL